MSSADSKFRPPATPSWAWAGAAVPTIRSRAKRDARTVEVRFGIMLKTWDEKKVSANSPREGGNQILSV
jgi:hypothetical protein